MLVVVAAGGDGVARRFVARHRSSARPISLLTPADLHTPGWRVESENHHAVAVVEGQHLPASEITGVVTRLTSVREADLAPIHPDDREYVAAEMTAFLLSWLTSLCGPVLNPPAPPFLTSPCWRPEHWTVLAPTVGIPVEPLRRRAWPTEGRPRGDGADPAETRVTVVGEQVVAPPGASRDARALALALTRAAGVDLLTVRFAAGPRGMRFVGAHPWADLSAPPVECAVLDYFDARGGAR